MPDVYLPRPLRVVTRASILARRQTEWVVERLRAAWPDLAVEIVLASTSGDRDKQTPLTSLGQGVFVKGVEERLLAGEADIAVHSLKDVPTLLTPGLEVVAFPTREDPRDGLVCRVGGDLGSLPPGARVGTGSPRRAAQLLALRSDLEILPIRGNLDTRIRKLRDGDYDAIAIAVAGPTRLEQPFLIDHAFGVEECTPCVGQGALAIQCRSDDAVARSLVAPLDDGECRAEVLAERAFLAALGGGCLLPVGGLGRVRGGELDLIGVAASPDGRRLVRERRSGPASDPVSLGRELAERLLPRAGDLLPTAGVGT